jgi:hypothetical protein
MGPAALRRLISLLVVCLLTAGTALALDDEELRAFGVLLGLDDPGAFAAVTTSLRETGRLPSYYVRKGEASELGWRPGSDLCAVAPDRVIGGDRFQNREGHLPDRPGRRWYEADLDFDCGRRGARRLVFSNDGLIFVTIDHTTASSRCPNDRTPSRLDGRQRTKRRSF